MELLKDAKAAGSVIQELVAKSDEDGGLISIEHTIKQIIGK